jgi:hypothetical protein
MLWPGEQDGLGMKAYRAEIARKELFSLGNGVLVLDNLALTVVIQRNEAKYSREGVAIPLLLVYVELGLRVCLEVPFLEKGLIPFTDRTESIGLRFSATMQYMKQGIGIGVEFLGQFLFRVRHVRSGAHQSGECSRGTNCGKR